MPNASLTIPCERCAEIHTYDITKANIQDGTILNFACLNIMRLPKVTSFRIDSIPDDDQRAQVQRIQKYGAANAEAKYLRWKEINRTRLWLIHDFDIFFEEIRDSYVQGSFYCAAVSSTTLAERLTNLFFSRLKSLYSRDLLDAKLQKYIYEQDQNWQSFRKNLKVLESWNLLTYDQKKYFNELYSIRHRAVHFQADFNPESDALLAINTLHNLLDSYFSQLKRDDLLRIFQVPGEIWVKKSVLKQPFVKTFVLPNCSDFASEGMVSRRSNKYHENFSKPGFMTENEFIERRLEFQDKARKNENWLSYTPENIVGCKIGSKNLRYRVV